MSARCLIAIRGEDQHYYSIYCHLLPSTAIYCHLLPSTAIYCHLLPSTAIMMAMTTIARLD